MINYTTINENTQANKFEIIINIKCLVDKSELLYDNEPLETTLTPTQIKERAEKEIGDSLHSRYGESAEVSISIKPLI